MPIICLPGGINDSAPLQILLIIRLCLVRTVISPAWQNSGRTQMSPTFGSASRKCLAPWDGHPQLPHDKRRDGGRAGPGVYATRDSAVMGNHGATFAATEERRGAKAVLERTVAVLKTLEWRIGVIRRALEDPDRWSYTSFSKPKTIAGRHVLSQVFLFIARTSP